MMKFGDGGASQVLVGLNRVGIVGLRDALKKVGESGLTEREAIVDLLIETLGTNNYIHDPRNDIYRRALWREYRRYRGEDIRDLFSEIDVTIRGEAGEKRDTFVKMLEAVLAEFELKPRVAFDSAGRVSPSPQLVIGGETVAQGPQTRSGLKNAVHKTISGW